MKIRNCDHLNASTLLVPGCQGFFGNVIAGRFGNSNPFPFVFSWMASSSTVQLSWKEFFIFRRQEVLKLTVCAALQLPGMGGG